MDDYKILIYILFGIIYVVTRALKAKKKGAPSNQAPIPGQDSSPEPPQKTAPSSLEELLKEFGVDMPEEDLVQEPEIEKFEPEPFKSVSHHNTDMDTELTSSLKGIKEKIVAPIVDHDDAYHDQPDEPNVIAELLHSREGIRNAIIMNEVLNRRY